MGCDIHTQAEKKINGKWESLNFSPFHWRSYGMFGFLANVRNYSAVPFLSEPRGLPEDIDDQYLDYDNLLGEHSFSWLSIEELINFDYDQEFEDRRYTRQVSERFWSGSETCQPGEGSKTTYREFLGENFFEDLKKLQALGAERIVFGFDS